jgi:hypothetical protein
MHTSVLVSQFRASQWSTRPRCSSVLTLSGMLWIVVQYGQPTCSEECVRVCVVCVVCVVCALVVIVVCRVSCVLCGRRTSRERIAVCV